MSGRPNINFKLFKKQFINFVDKTKVAENVTLVSMDVTSLYTNIPQEEGIDTVCKAYDTFYGSKPPIPTQYLREIILGVSCTLRRTLSNSMGKTISRHTEPQWERKWQLLSLPVFSWPRLRQKL